MGKHSALLYSSFLAIGGFLFGYDSGIISQAIAVDSFQTYFNKPDDTTVGGVVSAFQGGAVLGTIINMLFAHSMGRKKTIWVGSIVSIIGSALQAGAANMPMLIVGRFIGGAAVGMLTSTIPLYAAEISPPRWRGLQSGLLQWFLSWGFLIAQWLGYGLSFASGTVQWRFPLAFQIVPGAILLAGIFFMPESPRWLMEKDRPDDAHKVLLRIRDSTHESEKIQLELAEIRDVIEADRINGQSSWKTIFTKPSWRRRLLLGCGVQAFGPLSGINVINYYGPRIYGLLGIDVQTSLLIVGISGALSIVYCSIGLYAVDKVGRVKPLIFSAIGLGASLLANAVMSQFLDGAGSNQLRAMVAMNFVFSLAYTPTGIISWVYPAEIFPVEVRALGNAITTFTNWIINLIFAQFSPQALSTIGFRYFYVFFVFNVIAALCYTFLYPETKGKTLEQLDELFGDQLVPHALEDPEGARNAEKQMGMVSHVEERD